MTESSGQLEEWPFPNNAWPRGPWLMEGRVATVWFTTARKYVHRFGNRQLLGPEPEVPCRLRYYDIKYTSMDKSGDRECPEQGYFREAVVAHRGRIGEHVGDVSAVMFTDSFVYQSWGREVFGWPLEPASFQFTGPVWSNPMRSGVSRAMCASDDISMTLECSLGREASLAAPPPVNWLTPRTVQTGWPATERHELLLVRPRWITAGRRYSLDSPKIEMSLPEGHPFEGLVGAIGFGEVLDGFAMVVGESCEVISAAMVADHVTSVGAESSRTVGDSS
jgi:hypothetical protein